MSQAQIKSGELKRRAENGSARSDGNRKAMKPKARIIRPAIASEVSTSIVITAGAPACPGSSRHIKNK